MKEHSSEPLPDDPTPDQLAAATTAQVNELWERLRAKAIIKAQLSTRPDPDPITGTMDIGSMEAAWARATGVLTSSGKRIHSLESEPFFMADPPLTRHPHLPNAS